MNYLSEVKIVFRHAFRLQSTARISALNYSTKDTAAATEAPVKDDEIYNEDELGKQDVSELLVTEDVDAEQREQEIQRKRNKSRLNRTHRSFMKNEPRPMEDLKTTVTLYMTRKQYALYGSASGVDPRLCFHTPAELADKEEYDRVKYPLTIQEMVENVKREKAEKAKAIRDRENKIQANLAKLDKWKSDLEIRLTKKETEARLAKAKREQLLEDIRQEIGFKIDFKDPRFKALMEKKELEAKKAKKADKKKKREELLVAKVKEEAQAALTAKKEGDEEDAEKGDEKNVAKSKEKEMKKKATKGGTEDDSSDSDSSDSEDDEKGGKSKK